MRSRRSLTAHTPSSVTTSRVTTVGLVSAAVVAGLLTTGAAAADASTVKPAVPTGLKVVAASRSGFTVALAPAAHGRTYRVYTSTVKADLYQDALGEQSNRRTDAVATTPRITVSGLPYTTQPYYYRVSVTNGKRSSWSKVSSTGATLEPATPSSVSVESGSGGAPVVNWASGAATGYSIRQSTTPDFSSDVTSYVSRGPATQFTPSATTAGTTYYYRVRALNGRTPSPFSTVVAATATPRQQPLRVLTYNVRSANLPHDEAPWKTRLPAIVNLIKSGSPDVFGVEEAGSYVHGKARQVDTIASHLRGYKVADTDVTPSGAVVRWNGNYIVYRRSAMTPITTGGHWVLSQKRTAAYTAFRTSAGAKLLVVDTHLIVGAGHKADTDRRSETAELLKHAHAYAAKFGITSIIVTGDFNSFYGQWHDADSAGTLMRAAGMSDAKLAAQKLYNAQYSSINHYDRKAPKTGGASDHVYSSAGIGVTAWGELLHVKHGHFVGVIPSDHNAVWTSLVLPIN